MRVVTRFRDLDDQTWASFVADDSPVYDSTNLVGEKLVHTAPATASRNHIVTTSDSVEGLRVTSTLTNASMSGPPAPDYAPIRSVVDYRLTNLAKLDPDQGAADLTCVGICSNITYGVSGNATVGSVHGMTSFVNVLTSASIETEQAAFMGFVNAGNEGTYTGASAPVSRVWGLDLSVNGPIGQQPRLLNCATFFVGNHYNGDSSSSPTGGVWVVTKPRKGGGLADYFNTTKYAIPVGIGVVGYAGAVTGIPEHATPNPNHRTTGFTVGIRVGGYGSGWMTSADASSGARGSIIGTGMVLTDIVTAGLHLLNPIGTAATAIDFGVDAVGAAWDWLFRFRDSISNPPTTGALMLPGGNNTKGQVRWGDTSDTNAPIIHRSANQVLNVNAGLVIYPASVVVDPMVAVGNAASTNALSVTLTNSAATTTLFQERAAAGGAYLSTANPGDAGLKVGANNLLFGVGTTELVRMGLTANRFVTVNGQLTAIAPAVGAAPLIVRGIASMTAAHQAFQLPTTDGSPTTANLAYYSVSWGASGLLASRQPRWKLELEDFAATREAIRADADGTQVYTTIFGHVRLPEVSAPAAPPAGYGALYPKTDGKLYWRASTALGGTEYDLTTAAGGGMSIGGAVTSGTAGSVLFVNAGPVLAQDNANFNYDDAANRLSVANLTIGSLSGILKAATGAVSAAVAGTDYVANLDAAAILAPAASTRNVIQPTGAAVVPLILRGAASQSGDILQVQNSATTTLSSITADGRIKGPDGAAATPGFSFQNDTNTGLYRVSADVLALATNGVERVRVSTTTVTIADSLTIAALGGVLKATAGLVSAAVAGTDYVANLNDAVILAPAVSTRNVVQPANSGIKALVVRGAIGQTESLQEWQDANGDIFGFMKLNQFCVSPLLGNTNTVIYPFVVGQRTTGTPAAGLGAGIQFNIETTTEPEGAPAAYAAATWTDPIHAQRRGRLAFSVVDNNATREGLRIDTNGTATTTTILGTAVIGSLTGLLKAATGTVSVAVAGTDYVANLDTVPLLAPAASTRNVIQPTGAGIVPFLLRGFASQTADLAQFQNSTPTVLSRITPTGAFAGRDGSGADSAGADALIAAGRSTGNAASGSIRLQVSLGGSSGSSLNALTDRFVTDEFVSTLYVSGGTGDALFIRNRNAASSGTTTRDVAGVVFRGFYWDGAASQLADGQVWLDVTGNNTYNLVLGMAGVDRLQVAQDGALTAIAANGTTTSAPAVLTLKHNIAGTPGAGFGSEVRFQLESSTTDNTDAAAITTTWATATHASRKGRLTLSVYDTAVREGLRIDTDGSNAAVILGGGAALAHLTSYVPTAATIGQVIRLAASPTADAWQVQRSDGVTMFRFRADGTFSLGQLGLSMWDGIYGRLYINPAGIAGFDNTTLDVSLGVVARAAAVPAVIVRGAASQTSNLTEWQNSAGTVLASISAEGAALFRPTSTTVVPIVIQGAVGHSENLQRWEDSSANLLGRMSQNGLFEHYRRTTETVTIQRATTVGHNTSGTPGAGFGTRSMWVLESSTTENREAAALDVSWVTATDASRAARAQWFVYDTAQREVLRMQASGTAPMLGFFGVAAVTRPGSYTPTNVTTDRSFDANATTLDEVADVLGTLVADLQSLGLIS